MIVVVYQPHILVLLAALLVLSGRWRHRRVFLHACDEVVERGLYHVGRRVCAGRGAGRQYAAVCGLLLRGVGEGWCGGVGGWTCLCIVSRGNNGSREEE